jgi:hypothetical protein
MTYDPTAALQALIKGATPTISDGPLVPKTGVTVTERPATLCFLLLQFTTPNNSLPEDFFNLPREKGKSGAALKAHVRPDGGVFLGAFEAPTDPAGVVVVFGDPLMRESEAVQVSREYRTMVTKQILQLRDARESPKVPRELRIN